MDWNYWERSWKGGGEDSGARMERWGDPRGATEVVRLKLHRTKREALTNNNPDVQSRRRATEDTA